MEHPVVPSLKSKMAAFRTGDIPLPKEYIDLHKYYAQRNLGEMCHMFGFRILITEMVPAGPFEGMKVLRVVTEDSVGRLHDVRWSDADGGTWFERTQDSLGLRLLMEVPDGKKPGYI